MKRIHLLLFSIFILMALFFRITCGIFVIQPIGSISEGTSIVYWRVGTNLPFISSIEGIILKAGLKVSLINRGRMSAKVVNPIHENELFRLSYSEYLFLKSSGGIEFNK